MNWDTFASVVKKLLKYLLVINLYSILTSDNPRYTCNRRDGMLTAHEVYAVHSAVDLTYCRYWELKRGNDKARQKKSRLKVERVEMKGSNGLKV